MQREVCDFDVGWKFSPCDATGAEAPDFDDTSWRVLKVPHDWAFEADYGPTAAQQDKGGYKPGGIGWYRKTFDLRSHWNNRCVSVEFDAIYMNSEVWINGAYLGKRPYGYISFGYELTEHLQPGKNTIAVRVDNSLEPSARWYHGCGIYGHVKLRCAAAIHIARDGVYISTPEITASKAVVNVATGVVNKSGEPSTITLETKLFNPAHEQVATCSTERSIQPDATGVINQTLVVSTPELWDTERPHLYKAVSRIISGGTDTDRATTCFGIRTVHWDTKTGFWLNGKNVKLLGISDHLEAGPVGAAIPDELIRWKIRRLQKMGCNAIRTAHNPQVPVFYDLCDEMGMLVMDEIFDGWKGKAVHDYGKQAFCRWWETDLRSWIKRDRNHPCVIIWSLGNETDGDVASDLVRACHELDPSRLATSGQAGTLAMDVLGMNGCSEKTRFFERCSEEPPERPFVSTEAPHTWQVRGYYRSKSWFRNGFPNEKQQPFPCPDLTEAEVFTYDWCPPSKQANPKQVFNSSYDNAMVRITARRNWELMRDLPWHSGHFRWTGFDYLGEAGFVHGGWPFRAFMGGALDLAGFEKDLFYFYQSQWTDEPMAHILPHWTHPQMEAGTEVPVWVYTNCDEIELFLNGASLGKRQPGTAWEKMQCEWMVPWTPGTLTAVGYKNGKESVRAAQSSAAAPARLTLHAEGDTCPIITVTQTDESGVMNPYAENRIHYHMVGPVRILSLESGNPVNTENNHGARSRRTFFGLGRAFLQTTAAEGDILAVVGAICGEKQLMTSNKICIDVRSIALRGASKKCSLRVLYSTDGSTPGTPYTTPFEVSQGTIVDAEVYRDGQLLFAMRERFGHDEGIYWPATGETRQ